MKAYSLLFLRISTGLLLVLWGVIKMGSPEAAISVSYRYYAGLISGESMQMALGIAEIALGLLVCAGLLRRFVYPLQAIVLFLGVAFIWNHILDPLGLWLVEEENRRTLFFPSLGMFAATLIMLAFKEDDRISLDERFGL
ncbi:MAG: hypothetical protein AAF950_07405 [Pseudomonadota bacterium]